MQIPRIALESSLLDAGTVHTESRGIFVKAVSPCADGAVGMGEIFRDYSTAVIKRAAWYQSLRREKASEMLGLKKKRG